MNPKCVLPAVAVLLAAAGPPPAAAPEHPVLVPTRDALVAYHLSPATGEAINVRVAVRAGGKTVRVDLPDASYMIATPATRELTMVVPLAKTVLDLPYNDGPQGLFMLDDKMRFTRKAEAAVAGQRCTNWDVTTEKGHSSVCVTADGLVLRSQTQDPMGRRNLIEAIGLRYQSLPDSEYDLPQDYERLRPPTGTPPK